MRGSFGGRRRIRTATPGSCRAGRRRRSASAPPRDREPSLRDDGKDSAVRFRDRRDAGWLLARRLAGHRRADHSVVLGLPRGGVVPAVEVARALELPLDVIVSRKLRHPAQPEFTIGAVAEGGEPYLAPRLEPPSAAWHGYVEREIGHQRAEIVRLQQLYRGGKPLVLDEGTRVILIDDGVETAATVIAAVDALRRQPIARLVLAAPVVPRETLRRLEPLVDEIVALATPGLFWAIRGFYEEFKQVPEAEVCELLDQAHRELPPGTGA